MPEIMVDGKFPVISQIYVPNGLCCNNIGLDNVCQYFEDETSNFPYAICFLFDKTLHMTEDIDGDWRYGKCPACLEACKRAETESVTDCNGLEEK